MILRGKVILSEPIFIGLYRRVPQKVFDTIFLSEKSLRLAKVWASIIWLILVSCIMAASAVGQARKGKSEPLNAEFEHCLPHQAKYNREIYKLSDGRWKTVDRFLNGSIKAEGYYQNRALTIKTDTFRTYYLNGQLESEKVYFNNTRNGVWRWYYISGQPIVVGKYFDHKAISPWKWYGDIAEYYDPNDTLNLELISPYRGLPQTVSGESPFRGFKRTDFPVHDAMENNFGFNFPCFKVNKRGKTVDIQFAVNGSEGMDETTFYYASKFPTFHPAISKGKYVESCYCWPAVYLQRAEQNIIHDQNIMTYQELSHRLFKFSLKKIGEKEFLMAKTVLHWAIYFYDQDPAYHHNLAVCYEKLGDRRSACAYFEIANILNPKLVSQQIKNTCGID